MTKTIAITAIVLVAIVMGLSTIAPALQQAFAHDVDIGGPLASGQCPADFKVVRADFIGQHPDHNANGWVCIRCPGIPDIACPDPTLVVIDDSFVRR